MSRHPLLRRLLAAATATCAVTIPVRAQSSLEYNVKAALLVKFVRFIEWPERAFADPQSPVEVCVLAPNPFAEALAAALQGEMVGTRALTARDVKSASAGADCHLLFVPAGAESRAAALIRSPGSHTVTVGESRRFEQMGGAVSFVLEGGRVRFNVNLRPVEERGVRISARMLQLASRVDRATPEK
jgi:hypothetical protein